MTSQTLDVAISFTVFYRYERLYDNYENFKNTSEIEQDHHEISPTTSPLTRNPTIPPKSGLRTPKVMAAIVGLESCH